MWEVIEFVSGLILILGGGLTLFRGFALDESNDIKKVRLASRLIFVSTWVILAGVACMVL